MTSPTLNPLKAKLASGQPAAGFLVSMPSPHLTQLLAAAGFDWLFIDMEHGPIDIQTAHAMIMSTQGTATAPLVRVPWNLHWLVKPVLDSGAMGVIFPLIHNADEARAAVSATLYPPAGERGFGPMFAPARFGVPMADYADHADRDVMTVLLIEHCDAVDDIDNIAAVEGVDACLIAPFDLALSYGYRDGADHAEVQDAIARVEAALAPGDVHLGGLALDAAAAAALVQKGYSMILAGIDAMMINEKAAELLGRVREIPRSTPTAPSG